MRGRKLKILSIMLAIVAFATPALMLGADAPRSYVSGNYTLSIDGQNTGFVKAVSGGAISAEVINEPSGPSYYTKKHIGQPKYGDLEINLGFSSTKNIYDWISSSWKASYQRKNITITMYDFQLQAKSTRDFNQSLITETTIPAMDGGSKEPAYLTIKIAPETIREKDAGGGKLSGEYGKNEQKIFLPSNFKLEIDGLDCTKVIKIESFAVKQPAVTDDIGQSRDYLKEPGKLEFPNLKITMAEVSAEPWKKWHEEFVIKGNNDEGKEKNGTLTLLSPNRQVELARIRFFNMGIFKIEPEKAEANADAIKRTTVELYVEHMEFEYLNKIIP